MTKTILTPTTLKTITKNGDFVTIIKMLTSQSVGKVELICKPFNVTDDNPALKGTKFDKLVNTKFVLDFENLTYNKITDGKDDISKSENRQELISDFSDLIKASDKNNYSNIILYKNSTNTKNESLSEMIRRVIKEESATELSPGEVFVSFGSHRARDYATRALGELPNPLYSFTSGTHLYKVNQDQLAKLSGSKRIVMKQYKKLPKGEWLNSWKR
jgi:hypothetical protein